MKGRAARRMVTGDVVVVDYGAGNPASMVTMIEYLGYDAVRSAEPDVVAAAEKVVLPGVGHFDHCRSALDERGLVPALEHAAQERRVPFLGVCVGHQLLARGSEEGSLPGLGWVDAVVRRLTPGAAAKVPHAGWAPLERTDSVSRILASARQDQRTRFYYTHSYALPADAAGVVGDCRYGADTFGAVVEQGNVFGVQFHPEKSHRYGMALLADFLELAA